MTACDRRVGTPHRKPYRTLRQEHGRECMRCLPAVDYSLRLGPRRQFCLIVDQIVFDQYGLFQQPLPAFVNDIARVGARSWA